MIKIIGSNSLNCYNSVFLFFFFHIILWILLYSSFLFNKHIYSLNSITYLNIKLLLSKVYHSAPDDFSHGVDISLEIVSLPPWA